MFSDENGSSIAHHLIPNRPNQSTQLFRANNQRSSYFNCFKIPLSKNSIEISFNQDRNQKPNERHFLKKGYPCLRMSQSTFSQRASLSRIREFYRLSHAMTS